MGDDVDFTDEPWGDDGKGNPLLVRIYQSSSSPEVAGRPAILDVHGGAWSSKDRTLDELCNRALAAAGFVVAAIDFRQGPAHQHPSASSDVVAALCWVRDNAVRLGVDSDRVGILGSSSGGHLAMLAGVTPNAEHHRGTRSGDRVVAPPNFIIALWPVSDPFSRYRYAKRAKISHLVEAHDGFYLTEDAMRAASVPRVVVAGEAESLPPLLIVQPGEDGNVPLDITFDLMRSWQSRGGYLEYSYFPGEPHAFGLNDGPATRRMVSLLVDFVRRHCQKGAQSRTPENSRKRKLN